MLSVIWGWTILACPVAFIAGFVWIRRATELKSPVDDIPTAGQWLFISLGVAALFIVFGIALFVIGMGHGGAHMFSSVAMFALIIGPLLYCVYTYRWIRKVRRRLKEQSIHRSAQ